MISVARGLLRGPTLRTPWFEVGVLRLVTTSVAACRVWLSTVSVRPVAENVAFGELKVKLLNGSPVKSSTMLTFRFTVNDPVESMVTARRLELSLQLSTSGQPVKIRYSRKEMFHHCRGRHKQTIDMKIGMKKDGTITAVEQKSVLEGGAYSSFGVVAVYYSGAMVPTLYKLPHYRYDGYRINTNLPTCGAMRSSRYEANILHL